MSVSELVIHTKLSPKSISTSQLCREHVDLKKGCMESRNVPLEKWAGAASEGLCWLLLQYADLWRAALEEAENAAGLRVFMRRRAAPRCMAATGYWKRHWVDNLSCYQTSWEEVGEWGSAHSSSHLSSDFPLHYFCHYTPVSRTQWWNLYFGWQVSAWLHLMSGKWFIIQTDHIRSVTWTFWFDIDH